MSNIDALCQLLTGKQQHSVRAIADMQTRIRDTINMESFLAARDSADVHSIDGLFCLLFINLALVELAKDLGARVVGQTYSVISSVEECKRADNVPTPR